MPNARVLGPSSPEASSPRTLPQAMNRRQMLRTLVATGSVAAGASLLAACGGDNNKTSTTSTTPVSLLFGSWPFTIPAALKKGETNPRAIAESAVIQDWLKKNPNVTLKYTAIDTSTTQKLQAAIAGRTAPDIYGSLGNLALDRAASALGFAADTTEIIKKYNVESLLADYALPLWKQRGDVNGKFYGLPGDAINVGAGLYYRRDVLQQKGIAEPTENWTWNDFRTLAKSVAAPGKPAMGAPSYMIGWFINANGLDPQPNGGILGSNPAPNESWHWRVNVTAWAEEWKTITTLYRNLVNTDKLINQNNTAYPWEGPAVSQFAAGQYPLSPGFAFLYAIAGYGPTVIGDMEKKFNKPVDELVGFTPYPNGTNGAKNAATNASFGAVLLNPHLKQAGLEKTSELWLHMFYGDGYVNTRAQTYAKSNDPKTAYDYIAPANKFQKNPKLPADLTVEKVYGQKFVADYMKFVRLPQVPDAGLFFGPDTQTGPTGDAHTAALQALSSTNQDVADVLTKFQTTYNQQASTLKSDLSAQQFKEGARNYFKALDDFWKEKAPEFYSGDWTKFYTTQVQPALS